MSHVCYIPVYKMKTDISNYKCGIALTCEGLDPHSYFINCVNQQELPFIFFILVNTYALFSLLLEI